MFCALLPFARFASANRQISHASFVTRAICIVKKIKCYPVFPIVILNNTIITY